MIRRIFIGLFMMLALVAMTVTCAPGQDMKSQVMVSLTEMAKAGVNSIDAEITKGDKQLYTTEENLLKLQQVLAPALKWVEYQKSQPWKTGSWLTRVAPEGLAQLKNDRYQVTKLEFAAQEIGTANPKFISTIEVSGSSGGGGGDGLALEKQLKDQQTGLEQLREQKLKKRALVISTINSIVSSQAKDWQVRGAGKNTYVVSGPNLGWADKLTSGQWMYNSETKQLTPADGNAVALKSLLSGE